MSSDNPFEVSPSAYGDRSGSDRSPVTAEVSPRSIEMLNQTRPWVLLIGVLFWIGTVLIGLATLGAIIGGLLSGQPGFLMIGGMYLVITVIYGVFAKSLTGYASRISRLNSSERIEDLEDALQSQKTFWKLSGIITLIMIVVYIGAIVLFLTGAIAMNQFMQR